MRFTHSLILALLPTLSLASPFHPQIEAVSGRQSSSHRGTPPTLAQTLSTSEKPAEKLQRQKDACKAACKRDRRSSLVDVRRTITVKECNTFCEDNAQFLNEKYSGDSEKTIASPKLASPKLASPELATQQQAPSKEVDEDDVEENMPSCKPTKICVKKVLFSIQCSTSIASRYPATAHQQARDYEACAALCQRNECIAFDYDVVTGMCSAYPMTTDFDVTRVTDKAFVSGTVRGSC